MENQIQTLYQFPMKVYAPGSPVVIESAVLNLDVAANKVFSVFQIRNIANKIVRSCKIRIWANDEAGNTIQFIDEYLYANVNTPEGGVFGVNFPIFFDNNNTRTMSVVVLSVLFDDNTIWDGSNAMWDWLREAAPMQEQSTPVQEQIPPAQEQAPPTQEQTSAPQGQASPVQEQMSPINEQVPPVKPAPKKKKKKGVIGVILALLALGALFVAILVVVGIFVIWPFAKKEMAYRSASELLAAESYDEAYAAYTELNDYRDAKELAKEALYGKADSYFAEGKYRDSIEVWSSIIDYKDSAARIKEADTAILEEKYKRANEAVGVGDYLSASQLFAEIFDYKDSADRYLDAIYMYALDLYWTEDYVTAIYYFSQCQGYSDSAEKILDCKYGYAYSHRDSNDETTYEYISDLIDIGYSGATNLYNEIYQWRVTITAVNTDPDDSVHSASSASRYDYIYFHYSVSGGAPGESEDISFVGYLPNCDPVYLDGTIYSGLDSYYYIYYTRGGASGTAYAYFYDSNGNLLASDSIYLY